jgi:hypothetical protein
MSAKKSNSGGAYAPRFVASKRTKSERTTPSGRKRKPSRGQGRP